ncbi:type II toxin-antitoxin system RelE/ParE family toxin [Planktothrix sp. FACHB-1355]|uniref:Type II toxin-antitoxin system RelE/ParE family toxin n=1 Tax=Aerosakkonema funiforme FACHB-1375 TaxID=2949571 RepID=A0A926VJ23_9CYAN|nr:MULTISPECIES: type II toxin-antitoxin system RelE/ParE family toxin [Oscillatoriales]MBD2184772.1 type II toxin-antitoxin system RelE/ParE family toxin [Aerosakkonema funiforme FACHB-1375]MBD3559059.1 type II toxin-antitoxin system RelE/ParE family toxin [Planktothrix sp. FACHB-1355]
MTNSNENTDLYTVAISSDAQEFFEAASAQLQRKLDRCFEMLKINPRNHPNIKPLKGDLAGYYRYRVGDYRVVYAINDEQQVVVVAIIAHRREVY